MLPGRVRGERIRRSFAHLDLSGVAILLKLFEAVGVGDGGGADVIKTEIVEDAHGFQLCGVDGNTSVSP